MGTRSNIGIEYEDGSIKFVYCHWDGYPSNNGQILFDHYQTRSEVEALVALGEISSLGATPSSTKDYHTWRDGDLVVLETDHRDRAFQQEYCYIFSVKNDTWYVKGVEENLWYIRASKDFEGWMELEQALDI
jgi:hypothetical protein